MLALVVPATVLAAPLTEVEPNDNLPSANGPIPADGFLATRATPDDHDDFILRLQGQRQVTLTLTRVSGCNELVNLNPTTFDLTARDGTEVIHFSNMSGKPPISTDRWTTPRDATEYIGDISGDGWWEGHQCQVLVQVTPADAVITGPLPAPPSAKITASSVKRNKKLTLIVTNVASAVSVKATWKPKKGKPTTRIGTVHNNKATIKAPKKKGSYKLTVTYLGKVLINKTTVKVT